jgi:hypothetical protein
VADGFDHGFYDSQNSTNVYINCTAVNSGIGFSVDPVYQIDIRPTWINCVSRQAATEHFRYYHYAPESDYNIASSGNPGDTPGPNSKIASVQFVDMANGDYHLSPSDTEARGFCPPYNGLAGYPQFTTDYEDHERGTTTWDAGADEFGSVPTLTGYPQIIIISE